MIVILHNALELDNTYGCDIYMFMNAIQAILLSITLTLLNELIKITDIQSDTHSI